MATKQELEQELKEVKAERDAIIDRSGGMTVIEIQLATLNGEMQRIDARLGELGQMSLREGEKAALRAMYAGTKDGLKADYDSMMKKLNGGK